MDSTENKNQNSNIAFVNAENCPADAVREYVETIVNYQKKCTEEGRQIPKEIILSPKNIEFLLNSKLVDLIGAGETGNEIQFYWKKTEQYPALELKVALKDDGTYELTYIKEDASAEKPEFLWEKDSNKSKNGTVVVFKETDALEDISDPFDKDI